MQKWWILWWRLTLHNHNECLDHIGRAILSWFPYILRVTVTTPSIARRLRKIGHHRNKIVMALGVSLIIKIDLWKECCRSIHLTLLPNSLSISLHLGDDLCGAHEDFLRTLWKGTEKMVALYSMMVYCAEYYSVTMTNFNWFNFQHLLLQQINAMRASKLTSK